MRHIFLADSLHRRRDARAVDEDAGDAMGLFGHIEARRGARFVRHIYLDENAPNLVGGSRASFLIEIEDGNPRAFARQLPGRGLSQRSEEHTSELQSLMRISYAVFCLKK